jgi:hypothetical protein
VSVTRAAALLAVLLAGVVPARAAPRADAAPEWLMMVVTRNTDPAREAEFNDWYDRIDLPDVLEVPGYERARRGRRVGTPAATPPADGDGPYVALYDVRSAAIDRTIIDLLMAARRMDKRGRGTTLLEVTERVYYRRRAPDVGGRAASGRATHLYVERVDCPSAGPVRRRFLAAYDGGHLAGARGDPLVRAVHRYELYRALWEEPRSAPAYLTLYELSAPDDGAALALVERLSAALAGPARAAGGCREQSSALYLQLADVPRAGR